VWVTVLASLTVLPIGGASVPVAASNVSVAGWLEAQVANLAVEVEGLKAMVLSQASAITALTALCQGVSATAGNLRAPSQAPLAQPQPQEEHKSLRTPAVESAGGPSWQGLRVGAGTGRVDGGATATGSASDADDSGVPCPCNAFPNATTVSPGPCFLHRNRLHTRARPRPGPSSDLCRW
jgi:hypothetical protein